MCESPSYGVDMLSFLSDLGYSLEPLHAVRGYPDNANLDKFKFILAKSTGYKPDELLLEACFSGSSLLLVSYLVSLGADVHQKDERGRFLLHLAASTNRSNDPVIPYLIGLGLDVNGRTPDGETALNLTMDSNFWEDYGRSHALTLLSCGADPTIGDREGRDIVSSACHREEVQWSDNGKRVLDAENRENLAHDE